MSRIVLSPRSYADESSTRWYTGYGIGAVVQLIGTPMAVLGALANGTEGVRFHVAGDYSF